MGTITSGTGLISGLDIESIVSQLMAIESNVKTNVESRIETLTARQTALMTLQARIMAIQVAAANFNKQNVFQQKSVTTSNEDVLTATATRFAAVGNYKFRVKRLATNQHMVSNSYSSLNSSVGSGTMTFEMGQGQLARETNLNFINGQQGFARGKISITDQAGHQAEIDLSSALTVQDILDEINGNSTIQVTASVSGDHLVITDNSNGTAGNLMIADVNGGRTALDLGIRQTVADGGDVLNGTNINYLTANTRLKSLNDGNGVRGLSGSSVLTEDLVFDWEDGPHFGVALSANMFKDANSSQSTTIQSLNSGAGVRQGKFRITDQNGAHVDIDLAELYEDNDDPTVAQLEEFIESEAIAAGMKNVSSEGVETSTIQVTFHGLDHLTINDNSTGFSTDEDGNRTSHFIIEDLDGGHAAADLGIVNDVGHGTITGEQVWFMETLGDVMNAVNNHWANDDGTGNQLVNITINDAGTGLKATNLVSSDPLAGGMTISAGTSLEQWAGEDLGLLTDTEIAVNESHTGRRLIAGLNTTLLRSLNGGSSRDTILSGQITYGENHIVDMASENLTLTDSNAMTYNIDLTTQKIETVQDLIDAINEQTKIGDVSQIKASINSVGNGLVLTDQAGGTGTMVVDGTLAEKLGIAEDGTGQVTEVNSGNLQSQYISGATLLDDMRQGQGIRRGKFTITDSSNQTYQIDLLQDSIKTIDDVVSAINSASKGTGVHSKVQARINDSGDGIVLWDEGGAFKVTENGGQTAHDLRLLGQSVQGTDGVNRIDGSYELRLDVGGGDSIEDITAMINEADVGIQASIINVGSVNDPSYRISFNSEVGGRAGRVYLDAGSTTLTTTTLAEGDDAIVLFGDGQSGDSLLVSSSSNTVSNIVKGVTLELHEASDTPVELTVDQDLDSVVAQIQSFVTAYNDAMKSIAQMTSYDPDTQEQGLLFADHTVRSIQGGLESIMSRTYTSNTINRLSQIGLKFKSLSSETGTDGNQTVNYAVAGTLQIQFDETTFRQAFEDDPDAVTTFFTQVESGFGDYIADQLESLAGSNDSTTSYRLNAMDSTKKLYQDRVDYLTERLAAKEASLYNQFYAMEQALASLQTQQSALSQLSSLAASYTS